MQTSLCFFELTVPSTLEFEEGSVPVETFPNDFTISCLSVQPVTLTNKIERINNNRNAFFSGMSKRLKVLS
jgi:hypothetical protein